MTAMLPDFSKIQQLLKCFKNLVTSVLIIEDPVGSNLNDHSEMLRSLPLGFKYFVDFHFKCGMIITLIVFNINGKNTLR